MLILDKPRPFDGETVSLPIYHRGHLSLFKGARLFMVLLPASAGPSQYPELVMSPISDESWRDLWRITLTLRDRPGLVHDILRVLSTRNLNVLVAETSSMERDRVHTVQVVCDASHYVSPFSDGDSEQRTNHEIEELKDLERWLLIELLQDLDLEPTTNNEHVKIRRMNALFRAARAWDQGELEYQRHLRDRPEHGNADVIEVGIRRKFQVRLPEPIRDALKRILRRSEGAEGFGKYLLVSDTRDRFLRIYFTPSHEQVLAPTLKHVEKTGALAAITGALAGQGFNVLTMLSRLYEQGKTAETEFVLSYVGNTQPDDKSLRDLLRSALATDELINTYQIEIAFPTNYKRTPDFKKIVRPKAGFSYTPRSPLTSPYEKVHALVEQYELVLKRPGARPDDRRRLDIARSLLADEARIHHHPQRKTVFISCAYWGSYVRKAKELASNAGFSVLTGEHLGGRTKTESIIKQIRACSHFLGVWTREGGYLLHRNGTYEPERYWPSPWMHWELGVADTLGLKCRLAVSKELEAESWAKIHADLPHQLFEGSDFEGVLAESLQDLFADDD